MDNDPPEPTVSRAAETCWRCGKLIEPSAVFCQHCRARLGPAPLALKAPPAERTHPLMIVLGAYSALMVTALMWAFVVHFSAAKDDGEHTAGTAVVEGLDTVIVVMAALAVGRLRLARPGFWFRAAAWLLAPLALALVLAVNVGYRWVLIQFLQNQWLEDALSEPEWSTINVLLVAVQPAVVEEWFFRYLALGSLRTATNVHAAVWISAVMFAMAHIYNPLGLPWLFVAGVVFGYARVASGGLAVPILMHFAHNAIILWFRGFV